jgi:O-antigen/teichoic acid export membrane protein
LSGEKIRVQYSGLIIFLAQILSVGTGLVFTLLLTRNMNSDQYGTWTFIYYVTSIFVVISTVFPFWATRFAARGKDGTIKTAVSANLLIGLAATLIYLPLLPYLMSTLHINSIYFLVYALASLQILDTYLITVLESCMRSIKPQAIGYGLLIEEVLKVAIAYIVFLSFNQLFIGAMLGLVVSALIQAFFYIWLLRDYLRRHIQWNYIVEWLKGSAAFIYNAVGGQLLGLVLWLLTLYGGQSALGNYQAALTFSNIVGYSASVSFALYPKLLAKNCPDDQIATSYRTMLMLAIPLAAVTIVMSSSFLTVLNITYASAWPILILLTVDTLITMTSTFYFSYLMGMEVLDEEGKIPLRQLVKSKIFKVFTVPYIQAAVALPLTYFVLTQAVSTPVLSASYVTGILICVHLSTFLGAYYYMKSTARLAIAWRSVGKYALAALIVGVMLYVLPHTSTLFFTVAKTLLGLGIYAGILLSIDAQARDLVQLVFKEISETLRSFFPKKRPELSGANNNGLTE